MKKLLSFIFMMLTVLVLASCSGGNNTASVKDAAVELANEIDRVGAPSTLITGSETANESTTETINLTSNKINMKYNMMLSDSYTDEVYNYESISLDDPEKSSDDVATYTNVKVPKWFKYNILAFRDAEQYLGIDTRGTDYKEFISSKYPYGVGEGSKEYDEYLGDYNFIRERNINFSLARNVSNSTSSNYLGIISMKNYILNHCNNPYMYVWNTQDELTKTRVTFEGDKLILEELRNNDNNGKYTKIYVERDSDNKIYYECFSYSYRTDSYDNTTTYTWGYCNYYEGKYFNSVGMSPNSYSFETIDITGDVPMMLSGAVLFDGTEISGHCYLSAVNDTLDSFVTGYVNIESTPDNQEGGHNKKNTYNIISMLNNKMIIGNYRLLNNPTNGIFDQYLTDEECSYTDYLALPAYDKFVKSIQKSDYDLVYEFNNGQMYSRPIEYLDNHTQDQRHIIDPYNFYDVREMFGEYDCNIVMPMYDDNQFDATEKMLKKYGYLDSNEKIDHNFIEPKIFGKKIDELTAEFFHETFIKNISVYDANAQWKTKDFSEYIKDYDESMKRPFELVADYSLSGKVIINEDSLDFSNVSLTINSVKINDSDYEFNMYDIAQYNIYYKGILIGKASSTVTDGKSIMINPGVIEFDNIKDWAKERLANVESEPDKIEIELYGVYAYIELEFEIGTE